MDLRYLKSFYILSQELNFTRAAEKLGYTQANVTLQIQSLEEEVHTQLFNRIGKNITLTETGKKLVPIVAKMINLEESIVHIEDDEGSGTIRIGVCDSLCINRVPKIICKFKEQYPNVTFTLDILKCSEFYSKLTQNQLDLAFTIGYLKKEEHIYYSAEMEEKIAVLASPNHPLTKKNSLTAKDFSGIPLILAEKAAYYRINFERDLLINNITPMIIIETESIQAIKKLTENGLGISIMPEVAVQEELKNGALSVLNYSCNYDIYSHIIWHKDKQLSACQKSFISFAEKQIMNEKRTRD